MAGLSWYRHGSTTTRPRRGEAWNACWTFRSTCSASTTELRSPPSPGAPCGRRWADRPPGPDLRGGTMGPEPDRCWTYERTDPADWERPARAVRGRTGGDPQ